MYGSRIAAVLLACLVGSMAVAGQAAEPKSGCEQAKGADEERMCENESLAAMERAFVALARSAGDGGAVATLEDTRKRRARCGGDDICLTRATMAAIIALARRQGDAAGLSGRYTYAKGRDGGGELWLARMADGRVHGGIATVNGPTAHTCDILFDGATQSGRTIEWTATEAGAEGCRLTLQVRAGSVAVSATPACGPFYCGVRGFFETTYRRIER